jgi:hypothetical protein
MGWVAMGKVGTGRFGTGQSGMGWLRKKLQRTHLLLTGLIKESVFKICTKSSEKRRHRVQYLQGLLSQKADYKVL